jgi:hypothetical protein
MSYIDEVNKLKEQEKQQMLATLQKKRDAALSSLDTEQKDVDNTYYDKRNQSTVQNQLGAKSFAEYLASKGLTGGATSQAALMQNANLQNALTGLNRDEATKESDIGNRRTLANNTYNNDLASEYSRIEADASNKIAEYNRQQEELARQEAENEKNRQFQAKQNELARQSSARSYSSGGSRSSGGSSTASAKAQREEMENTAWINLRNSMANGTGKQWLEGHMEEIVGKLGNDFYSDMYNYYQKNDYGSNLAAERENDDDSAYRVVSGGRMLM